VDDATAALQRLAKRWRDQWAGLALGVTGSAGKTTTKDLTALVLGALGSTLKTEGNLNNHWGVPLTLLRLRPEHRAAVIEVAMSNPGEIAMLASLVAPQAAIITNAGTAHLEGMGSLEAIAAEKAELARAVPPGQPVFAGMDSPRLIAALAGLPCRVITFGFAARADVRPMRIEERGEEGVVFEVKGFPAVHLRLFGRHQVANALAALAVAREYGVDPRAAVDALEAYRPSKGRMEIAHAGGATLLIDTYNANPDSTRAALATLAGWPRASARIAVLGDMLELGPDAAQLHRETAAEARVSEVWVVGAHARDLERGARDAGAEVRVFEDKASLGAALAARLAPGLVVLLKASRGAALEDVLAGIERED
jgi:UDP-N-acetylmuramoyl-tripeptide--D-alanyl-D-alanine ligase